MNKLPQLVGEYEDLSGPDQERCRRVLRWLIEDDLLSATVALSAKPHVAVIHRSGWVSSSIDANVRPLHQQDAA